MKQSNKNPNKFEIRLLLSLVVTCVTVEAVELLAYEYMQKKDRQR